MPHRYFTSLLDIELHGLVERLMAFGGRCEAQTRQAAGAIALLDAAAASSVLLDEVTLNALEVELDRDLLSVMARRQPTARDLRLLMAISKMLANLERVGDEASKVARVAMHLARDDRVNAALPLVHVQMATELALRELRASLDAFARLDTRGAVTILRHDRVLDRSFAGFVEALVVAMRNEPAAIAGGLELLLAAKASERIGDHAKNIAELVIYAAQGHDVRHMNLQMVEGLVG